MKTSSKLYLVAALALVAGVGLTILVTSILGQPATDAADANSSVGSAADNGHDHGSGEDASTYYTCPMHPSVVSESPGACPVCHMDLIKKSKSGGGLDPQELAAIGKVSLSPTQRVLANVAVTEVDKVESAKQSAAKSEVRAVGIVTTDETGLATIPSWVSGRIERLLIEETGATVREGQPVIEIYSPDLFAAQQEYLVALDSTDETLVDATRQRLRLLGMSASQIEALRRTKNASQNVTMTAPNPGTVTRVMVRQGQYVEEGTPLYEIADLSKVWVEAEVYERDIASVEEGTKVRVVADAFPARPLEGEVTFIHPTLDSDTRTVKVRIELDNAANKLKPGMYTTVFFQTGAQEQGAQNEPADQKVELMVPKSAVIRGGKTNSVYVEVDDNVFERRQVEIGRATDDYLIVTDGLKAGEKVAYQGGFLLDSEVQLNSFGGSGSGHEGHEQKPTEKLEASDIPEGGKEFDPPVPSESVPEGLWFCDMGTSHWAQHEKGDGKCPVCGMFLKEKGAK